ncbi:MAG: hypothetical protein L3J66_01575 [Bacteroidales bacterium]|nr:hypothetical protein [Bacteroidales bacterium]
MTVRESVDEILKSKPYLEESLDDGLINLTALARSIAPEVSRLIGKAAATGAIVMAIQRHRPGKLAAIKISSGKLLRNLSNIIVRSGIAAHTYENSASLPVRLAEVSALFSKMKGLFYTFSQGVFETTIILNQAAGAELGTIMKKERQLAAAENLACITLYLPDENTEIAGYYYFILKMIAWEGINITEILSTTNEFSIILAEEDVDKAFSTLKNARLKAR